MLRALAAVAALCACLGLAACGEREEPEITPTTTEPQFQITGRWHGELRQAGMKPFTVQARIASLERFKDNTVHYTQAPQQRRGSATPRIDCSGTWEYLGSSETAYRFAEVIDSGRGAKCKRTGTVSLTPLAEDRVGYEFRGRGVVSHGELERVLPANSG
jgi:hypothetical protein